MSDNNVIILIILAAAAGFLLLRLRSILGTRSGFEEPEKFVRPNPAASNGEDDNDNVVTLPQRRDEEDDDDDIFAVTEPDSDLGKTLKAMKSVDDAFNVREFIEGSKAAYEMLLTAFESGDKETLEPYLSNEVFTAFSEAIDARESRNLSVDMRFIGFRTAELIEASYDPTDQKGEITMRFVSEVVTATRNAQGEIVEGDPHAVQKVTDVWTFTRIMGADDPNWVVVATGT